MLTILVSKGNVNQNHFKVPPTSVRVTTLKNINDNKCGKDMGGKGTIIYCWWNVRWYNHYGKLYGGALED
jgi:hypothetical protein